MLAAIGYLWWQTNQPWPVLLMFWLVSILLNMLSDWIRKKREPRAF